MSERFVFPDESVQRMLDRKPTLEGKIETAVNLAVGSISMCWETPSGAGVFQSEEAADIASQVAVAIMAEIHDAQKFAERYNLKDCVNRFCDALYVAGPSMKEHLDGMAAVNEEVPEFFMTAAYALGAYLNNQPGELDDSTMDAVLYLVKTYGSDVRAAAFLSGANALGGAINDLRISLELDDS